MFFANRPLFIWIYLAISAYVTFDLVFCGLSNIKYECIVQIVVGPLVFIISTLNLFSKFKWRKE